MLFYDPILTGIDCTDLRLSVVFKIDERLLQKVLVKKKKKNRQMQLDWFHHQQINE